MIISNKIYHLVMIYICWRRWQSCSSHINIDNIRLYYCLSVSSARPVSVCKYISGLMNVRSICISYLTPTKHSGDGQQKRR